MKMYDKNHELQTAVCNMCGKELLVEKGLLKDSIFEARQTFGYFSKKDGICHQFDLCEDCYDKLISSFQIPVMETEEKELL